MKRFFLLLFCLLTITLAQAHLITTVAGTGTPGYTGDGGAAVAARLGGGIYAVTGDALGNIYIADGTNNSIRKVSSSGIISTIAGTGTGGYSGDGAAATAAQLRFPAGVAIDVSGNIFIADQSNNRIRKINTSGIITTVAGTGAAGFSGDGGPATNAQIHAPWGIVVDNNGAIVIADYENNRIRRIDTFGIITTIAGTGTSGYSGDGAAATAADLTHPAGLAVSRTGAVYFADFSNNVVRVVHPYGIINTIAGTGATGFSGDGGAATAALLAAPYGVAINDSGDIYVADAGNNRIRKIGSGGIITSIAGTGTTGYSGDGGAATLALLNVPSGIAIDRQNNALVCDRSNNVIRHLVLNYAPSFVNGHHQTMSVCESVAISPTAINSLCAARDTEAGQRETWSVAATPPHGYLTVAYSAVSTGSAITPTGLTYAPLSAYVGNDTFSVRVSDGYRADTTTVIVTVRPLPLAGYIRGADSTCPGAYDTLDNPTGTAGGIWSHSDTFLTIADTTSGIVYGRASGTETVYYTVSDVCGTATAHLNVTVNTSPFSGAIVGADSLCIGASILLTNPTATPGGIWTSSDTSVAVINDTGLVLGRHGGTTYIFYNAHTNCGSSPAFKRIDVKPFAGIITGRDTVCLGDTINLSETVYGGVWSSGASSIASVSSSGIVSTVAAGTVTISFTTTSGTCGSATATHTVHVITTPSVGSITGTLTGCAGSSTTLAGTLSGGTWSSGSSAIASIEASSGVVSAIAAGSASITYSRANSCGTVSVTATFLVQIIPVVPPISGADSVCVGASVIATDATASGTWSLSNTNATLLSGTATTRTVSGVTTGFDTLTYIVTNSCGSTSQSKIIHILASANAGAITGPSSLCAGGAITLADTISGGVWSASNAHAVISTTGVLTGISGGIDTVFYAISNICGTAVARRIITVSPMPVVAPITGVSIVCPASVTTLSSTTSGGAWSASNGHATVTSGLVTGVSVGTDTIFYTITNSCGTASTNRIVTINPIITPSVNIGVSLDSIVCTGEGVTFTATPVNGGSAPYIRWMNSSSIVGSGLVYSYVPANGDHIKCVLVSNDGCALRDTFASNVIMMTVNPAMTPVALITASPNDTVAFVGQTITFGTSLSFCGPTPVYQWFLNGAAVSGATDSTYSTNVYRDDTVYCIVSCNLSCAAMTYNRTNIIVVCSKPLSVDEHSTAIFDLNIYPNPNPGEFYVQGQLNMQPDNEMELTILDMLGKVVYGQRLSIRNGRVDEKISLKKDLANGQYLLRLASKTGVKMIRLSVER